MKNRLYYSVIKGNDNNNQLIFKIFFNKNKQDAINKCKKIIKESNIINSDKLRIYISEISCNKLLFENSYTLYNYFNNTIVNGGDELYDKLLSIINCNRFHYDINLNEINYTTHY